MSWSLPAIPDPSTELVTLSEAKAQTRVDGDADDVTLTAYIAAARAHVEAYCGLLIGSRSVTVKCDTFADFALVPIVPMTSVSAIGYIDTAGEEQNLAADVYDLQSEAYATSIALRSGQRWPATQYQSRIMLDATVGLTTLPADIKLAILLLIGHWYETREAAGRESAPIPHGVDALLTNHRSSTC